jgi:hypothetical protein
MHYNELLFNILFGVTAVPGKRKDRLDQARRPFPIIRERSLVRLTFPVQQRSDCKPGQNELSAPSRGLID